MAQNTSRPKLQPEDQNQGELSPSLRRRYRHVRRLGEGGQGVVHFVEDAFLAGRLLVLKILRPQANAEWRKAFRHEFEALAGLKHPRLSDVHDFGASEDGRVFFTRDYVAGDDLRSASTGMSLESIVALFADVCRALKPLHARGLVHGDLKPGNIICSTDGLARLIDFSFVRGSDDDARRRGTVPYMSPEVIQGKQADARADLYSLGATMFEILSGAPPFEGTVTEIIHGHLSNPPSPPAPRRLGVVPSADRERLTAVQHIITRLLSKRANDRFPDIFELEAALTAVAPEAISPDPLPDYPMLSESVGRDRELKRIREAIGRRLAPSDESPLLVVEGQLGTGKSAVLRGVKWWAQLSGIPVLEVRCGGGGMLRPFADVIGQALFFLEGDPETAAQGETLQKLMTHPGSKGAHLDSLTKATGELLLKIAEDAKLVLTVDDVEQASPETLTVLRGLITAVESNDAVAILVTAETSFDWRNALGQGDSIALPVLSREQIAPLVKTFLGTSEKEIVERVLAHTGGNPLFVTTLLKDLAARGKGAEELERLGPPRQLEMYWRDRLTSLPAVERTAIEAVAVLGRPAELSDLAEITGQEEAVLEGALFALEAAGWIRRSASEWHLSTGPLGKEVLAAATPDTVRELHRGAMSVEPDEARMLIHAAGCGALDRVIDRGIPVARSLKRLGALDAARHLLESMRGALSGRPEADVVSLDLGEVCLAQGELEVAEAYLSPLTKKRDKTLKPTALLLLGRLHAAREALDDASRCLSKALEIQTTALATAEVRFELANVEFKRGDTAACIASAESGLTDVPRGHRVRADLLGLIAKAVVSQGRFEDALKHAEAAEADARLAGDRRSMALAIGILAWVYQRSGDHRRAAAELERSMMLHREFGDLPRLMRDQLVLGDLKLWLESWGSALAHYEQAVRLARTVSSPVLRLSVYNNYGFALIKLGCFERAQLVLSRSDQEATRLGHEELSLWARWHLAVLAAAKGEVREAMVGYEAVRQGFSRLNRHAIIPEIELAMANCLLFRGEPADLKDAGVLIQRASQRKREEEGRLFAESLQLQRGTLLVLEGRLEQGTALLDDLVTKTSEAGPLDFAWQAHAAAARGFTTGDTGFLARRRLRQAEEILDKLSAGLSAERRIAFWQDVQRARVRTALAELTPSSGFSSSQLISDTDVAPDAEARALYRVLEFNKRLLTEHDLDHLLEFILDAAVELTGAERGLVLMPSAEGGADLEIKAARDLKKEESEDPHDKFSRSIAESVYLDGEPVITVDAMSDQRFNEFLSIHELRLKSVACMPVIYRGRSLGVLYLENRLRRGRFGGSDLRVLAAFADQVAIAISQTRLIREARERAAELEEARQALQDAYDRKLEDLQLRDHDLQITRERVERMRQQLEGEGDYNGVVGLSRAMTKVFELVERIKDLDVPVVFIGESGTGKDLLARVMHEQSRLKEAPFVVVNCGSVPETLVESTLFGHTRGAFSGADRERAGILQAANGGTLYLDEIGDMSPRMQVDLLRVLQEGSFTPLGSSTTLSINVRIVASSRQPLEQLVEEGALRQDLLYRLQVVTVELPPLRDRKADIPSLARRILDREAAQFNQPTRPLSKRAVTALLAHHWPGNVRELEQLLRRTLAMGEGVGAIQKEEIFSPLESLRSTRETAPSPPEKDADEEARILAALDRNKWNRTKAAEELGMARRTFYRRIEKMGLVKKRR